MTQYVIGIDIGASATKAILLDDQKKIQGQFIKKTGFNMAESVRQAYETLLDSAHLTTQSIHKVIATGYGRHNVSFAQGTITEISAHARGAYYYFPRALTVIDIGGQDNKIIKVGPTGEVLSFKMNRKCAAGTGAFLEEIAYKMDVPLDTLNQLARGTNETIELGSYCTVFTATEILSKIRSGANKEAIIRGVFSSVIKRITEMDTLENDVLLTGGVIAHNTILQELFHQTLQKDILVPPNPQLIGALGAALSG
jgi:(R)-2-hydroxyacyl-CoA dehydratese activating ATPase